MSESTRYPHFKPVPSPKAAESGPLLRGPGAPGTTVTATDAKNQFAQILEIALRDGPVFIAKHGTTKAVLMSIEEYAALVQARRNPAMEALRQEFEAMYQRMQTPESRAAVEASFRSTPEEMGAAAVEAARKDRGAAP